MPKKAKMKKMAKNPLVLLWQKLIYIFRFLIICKIDACEKPIINDLGTFCAVDDTCPNRYDDLPGYLSRRRKRETNEVDDYEGDIFSGIF